MPKYDPEVANSSGYFKDPVTKEDLSVSMPRVVEPTMEEWTWPLVTASDGTQIKIVYAYFTDFEKQCYKAYRARGSASSSGEPRVVKSKEPKPKVDKPAVKTELKSIVKPLDDETVEEGPISVSEDTALIIANCDKLIGVTQMAGVTYVLLARSNKPHTIYHIPRSLINDEDMYRLCNGTIPEEIIE